MIEWRKGEMDYGDAWQRVMWLREQGIRIPRKPRFHDPLAGSAKEGRGWTSWKWRNASGTVQVEYNVPAEILDAEGGEINVWIANRPGLAVLYKFTFA